MTENTNVAQYDFFGIEFRVLGRPLGREETDRMKKTIRSQLSVAMATVITVVVALALPEQYPPVTGGRAAATLSRRRNRLVRCTL